ncbi:MAG: hypothetical protein M1445_08450, partial [Bacteroidetes bacterium]|nr:hypothetical protein [Bacteroidota bacterium]
TSVTGNFQSDSSIARDYYKGVKESRIIVYFDDDINIPRKHLIGYLKYLKTRCSMLIFAFRNDYDKEKIIDALKPVAVRDKYDEYIMVISY